MNNGGATSLVVSITVHSGPFPCCVLPCGLSIYLYTVLVLFIFSYFHTSKYDSVVKCCLCRVCWCDRCPHSLGSSPCLRASSLFKRRSTPSAFWLRTSCRSPCRDTQGLPWAVPRWHTASSPRCAFFVFCFFLATLVLHRHFRSLCSLFFWAARCLPQSIPCVISPGSRLGCLSSSVECSTYSRPHLVDLHRNILTDAPALFCDKIMAANKNKSVFQLLYRDSNLRPSVNLGLWHHSYNTTTVRTVSSSHDIAVCGTTTAVDARYFVRLSPGTSKHAYYR